MSRCLVVPKERRPLESVSSYHHVWLSSPAKLLCLSRSLRQLPLERWLLMPRGNLNGWASVLKTQPSRGSTSSGLNSRYRYFRVSCEQQEARGVTVLPPLHASLYLAAASVDVQKHQWHTRFAPQASFWSLILIQRLGSAPRGRRTAWSRRGTVARVSRLVCPRTRCPPCSTSRRPQTPCGIMRGHSALPWVQLVKTGAVRCRNSSMLRPCGWE